MKIAFFTDCYLDLTGGIVTSINTEKAELERRGHTVYVFSSAYPRSAKKRQTLARRHIYPVPSCRVFGRGLTPIARRPKVIEKWLEKAHPELQTFDIFYVHYEAGCSIAGLRLGRSLGIPTIQVMHGREDVGEAKLVPFGCRTLVATLLNWFHSRYLPHPVKVRPDGYLAKTIAAARMWTLMVNHANAADLVITPSGHFRQALLDYGVKREIIPLHHGVPDALVEAPVPLRPLLPGQPLRLIWHSRVSGEKRILPFLEALCYLAPDSYHLDAYGAGPDLKKARLFAKKHQLNVSFYGNADYKIIQKALRSAHLDVLVSYNYDTFGMILIEAEAAGAPVFIVDPAMREIVPEGGYVLAADPSPEQMAVAIREILTHPSKIAQMSRVMRDSRTSVRISETVTRLEQIFTDHLRPVENPPKSPKNL